MTSTTQIIPQPQSLISTLGSFTLNTESLLTWSGEGAGEVAALLAEYLRPATGFPFPVAQTTGGAIHLQATGGAIPDEAGFVDERYVLNVDESGIRLEAANATGLARGIQTLRQLLPAAIFSSSLQAADWRGACGIAIGCVDGGMLENISIRHVQMDQVRVSFFIKLGDRGRVASGEKEEIPVQFARNLSISHVSARPAGPRGGYIMGLPEEPVRGVRIENCDLEFEGGGDDVLAESSVDSNRDSYPSCDAFGMLPSYALFLRGAEDVKLSNLVFRTIAPDARPALRWQRVRNLQIDSASEKRP